MAATHAPTYGMNRRNTAITPHVSANGKPEDEEADRDRGAEARVERRLGQQVAADARRRLVEGAGGLGQPVGAEEPDDPRAQLALLQEHEDHQHGARRRRRRTAATIFGICQSGLGEDTTTGSGFVAGGWTLLDLRHHVVRRFLDLLERAAAAHALHVGDLSPDGRAIPRQILGQRGDLTEQRPAQPRAEQDRQRDDDDDRRDAMQADPAQQGDDRAQQERQQHRQRDRDEHDARPVQARDGENHGAQDDEAGLSRRCRPA